MQKILETCSVKKREKPSNDRGKPPNDRENTVKNVKTTTIKIHMENGNCETAELSHIYFISAWFKPE